MSKTHRETKNTAPPLSESEAELRQMLLRKRQELLARIQQERGGLQAVEMAETSLGDLAGRPVLTPEAEIGYEVVDHRAHTLAQIDLALKKLEDGTYGRCEICEEPIPPARLRALPFAIRCTRCQEEWERGAAREAAHAGEFARE